MKFILLLILIVFFNNCSINKVVKHHGVHFLEKKQNELKISNSNINDVKKILGPPSTQNIFDNEIWIYIERKTTISDFKSFGKKKVLLNNALVLEFDDRGILLKKDFYNKDTMNKYKINKDQTEVLNRKNNFIQSVLSSLKQKINDPLGKKSVR